MKQFFLFAIITSLLVACTKQDVTNNENFTVSHEMITLGNDAGSKKPFKIETGYSWKIKIPAADQQWLSFSQLEGTGNADVEAVTLQANHFNPPRISTVEIISIQPAGLKRRLMVQQNDTTIIKK